MHDHAAARASLARALSLFVLSVLSACTAPSLGSRSGDAKTSKPTARARADAAAKTSPAPGPERGPSIQARDRCKTLIELGLTRGEAFNRLRELTTFAPKRLSGSRGHAAAIEWARSKMLALGFDKVRTDRVMVPHWERGEIERVTLLGPGTQRALPALALGGSVGTQSAPGGRIEAELVIVRSTTQLDDEKVRGKIVLFNRPMPRALRNTFQAYRAAVPQRSSGPVEAAKHGARACLVRSMTTRVDNFPHTGATRYARGVPRIPAFAISTQAAEDLAALVSGGYVPRIRIESSARNLGEAESANVIGELRGVDKPDEIVVVGAYLDAWDVGQGAHDDGAGVAQCLETLRLITAAGLEPKRTIRCVLFTNEENGLRGGIAYDAKHGEEAHKAAIETDRGGFEPKGFTTSAKASRFAAIRRMLVPLAAEIDAGRLIPGGGGADISPLGKRGVELFGLLPAWHRYFDYHHSARDTIDAVNPRELQLGAVALAWLAYSLANEGSAP